MRLPIAAAALACGLATASLFAGCGSSGGGGTPAPSTPSTNLSALAQGTTVTTANNDTVTITARSAGLQPGAGAAPTLTTSSTQIVDASNDLHIAVRVPAGTTDILIGFEGVSGALDVHLAPAASRSRQTPTDEVVEINITHTEVLTIFGTTIPTHLNLDVVTVDSQGNQSGERSVEAAVSPLTQAVTTTTVGTGSSATVAAGGLTVPENATAAPVLTDVQLGSFLAFLVETTAPVDTILVGGAPGTNFPAHFIITPTPLPTVAGKTDYQYAIVIAIPDELKSSLTVGTSYKAGVQTERGGVLSQIATLTACNSSCGTSGFSILSLGGGGGCTTTTVASPFAGSFLSGAGPAPTVPASVTETNGTINFTVGTSAQVSHIFVNLGGVIYGADVSTSCSGKPGPYPIQISPIQIGPGTYGATVSTAPDSQGGLFQTSQEAPMSVTITSSR